MTYPPPRMLTITGNGPLALPGVSMGIACVPPAVG